MVESDKNNSLMVLVETPKSTKIESIPEIKNNGYKRKNLFL